MPPAFSLGRQIGYHERDTVQVCLAPMILNQLKLHFGVSTKSIIRIVFIATINALI